MLRQVLQAQSFNQVPYQLLQRLLLVPREARGGFVLEDSLRGLYLQFDNGNPGKVVLSTAGEDRLVALRLEGTGDRLLQNDRDLAEIAFLRYNASANAAFTQESTRILSMLREIRHGVDADSNIHSTDYLGEWAWNTTTGQLELHQNGRGWVIYQIPTTTSSPRMQDRNLAGSTNSYNLYMLPADIPVSADSVLQKAQFIANDVKRYETSYFSSLPVTQSSTRTNSKFTTIPVSSSLVAPSSAAPSSTAPGSTTSLVSGSSTALPDAYDVITSLQLE
ncbi:hypothetical protein TWF281_006711 [Arthrobotrys megalospora]